MIKKSHFRPSEIQWKKKDTVGILLIITWGLILTIISLLYTAIFDVVFSISLGFLIGGIIMSILSFFLAQMESNILGEGEVDVDVEVDVDMDVDVDVDADVDADVGADIDADVDVEMDADVDVEMDVDTDSDVDVEAASDITPAPIMLLFSTSLLLFGISGILLYYIFPEEYRFIMFFLSPFFAYISTKVINLIWKKIAKSRFYEIASTKNLIGTEGVVVLPIDDRGGLIKIKSNTPMKFEKIPVKPLIPFSTFERGEKVYICTTRDGKLLVDRDKNSIKIGERTRKN